VRPSCVRDVLDPAGDDPDAAATAPS